MLKNYFTIAIRTILRNKLFSGINIIGLAVSMSVGLVIIMLAADQLSYDRYNTNADKIYRINFDNLSNDGAFSRTATSAPAIAQSLIDDYTGVEQFARFRRGFGNDWLPVGNNENIPIGGFFADHSVLELFQYELQYGDPESALLDPRTVVITKTAAEKLFRKDNPVGEFIKVGKLGEFRITGVLKETENKSHVKFEALASMASLKQLVADSLISSDEHSMSNMWNGWSYIKLADGSSVEDIEEHLATINEAEYGDNDEANYKFYLQGLLEINPGPMLGNQIGPGMPAFMIYFLAILSFLIILSACFNYTTLSIARAMSRAREVGVRKVSGAVKGQIFGQFISEAIVVSLLALIVSFALLPVLKPAFQQLKLAQLLYWDLSLNGTVIAIFAIFAVVVGLMAGIFPAVFMSSVKPIAVLRDFSGMKLLSKLGVRKSLLVGQFVLSLFLIISVKLVHDQVTMMTKADYGFNPENIINVKLFGSSYDNLKNELSGRSGLTTLSGSSHTPGIGTMHTVEVLHESSEEPIDFSYFAVDIDYIEQMELELLAGSNFPTSVSNKNEQFLIINEEAVAALGWQSPAEAIGQPILTKDSLNLQIIGVLKSYNHMAMIMKISPMALRYKPDSYSRMQVKYNGDRDQAIKQIEAGWNKVNPDVKIEHKDLKAEIAEFYDLMFSDLVAITTLISILAISIACLGLLGMAVYTAETKAKEVSIRKVLGASHMVVLVTLSKGYAILLLIAVVIATPLSFYVNRLWLENMAFHVSISASTIIFGISIILGLGLITILSQTIKAVNSNTVDALRGE